MAETNRTWLLAERPDGRPDEDTFEFVERERPEPGRGEVLVRTLYMSVDPYMRGRMRDAESYAEPWAVGEPMQAGAVGEVVESEHHAWEAGDVVTGNLRWADYAVAKGHELVGVDPDLAPVSTALGVLGMPGRTAYFGLLDVGEPRPGDTVVVSGAAGAVGSVVGQIARHAGCRVVGVAGSDEKIAWLTDDLGFDAGINYQEEDVHERVAETCPDGVDVYYDNVGGPVTDAVMDNLAVRARVVVCGQISQYNATERPTGPRHFGTLIRTRARVEGVLVRDYEDRYEEANRRLARWVDDGTVQYRETVTEGLENAPDAFLGLFEGENVGKQLVRVAPYDGDDADRSGR
jgi:NADPH-dependent curcumin reductase CurA